MVDFSDTIYKFGFSNSAPNGNAIFRNLFKTFQNFLNYESFYNPFILVSIFQTPSTSLDSQIRPQMEITSFGFFSKLFKIFKIMNRSIIHIYLSVDFSDTLYKFGFSNSAPNGNHIFRILFKTF